MTGVGLTGAANTDARHAGELGDLPERPRRQESCFELITFQLVSIDKIGA
jgi:hypothetical protein